MSKAIYIAGVLALALGSYMLMENMKSAYKIMPIDSENLEANLKPFMTWEQFESASNGFTVQLPTAPQHATQTLPIPKSHKKRKYEMYAAENVDGTVFMINVITYPEDDSLPFDENFMQEVIQEMMETNPNNVLQKMDKSTFQGHMSFDFAIDNNEFNIDGKVILKDNIIYLISYIAKSEQFNKEEYQHFIDSFDLISSIRPLFKSVSGKYDQNALHSYSEF